MNNMDSKYLWLSLVAVALLVRIWGIGQFQHHLGDEAIHVPAAETYHQSGHANPDHYCHPPLKYILLYGSMQLFGNNPYGWRMRNVLFGALTILVLFLIGSELFPDRRIGFLAAALLALDPLHILLSRSTFDEIPAALFFLTGLYCLIRYLKNGSNSFLLSAGLFLGLAVSVKWYFIPAILVMVLFTLWYRAGEGHRSWRAAADAVSALMLLPLTVYLLVFTAWFGRGYSLLDFAEMQRDAYQELQSVQLQGLNGIFASSGSPVSWFVKPIMFGLTFPESGTAKRFIMFFNDPPVWMLTLPAMLYAGYRAGKGWMRMLLLVPLLFFAVYGQFLFFKRPILLYSAITCLPLSFLVIAAVAVALIDRTRHAASAYAFLLAGLLIWGAYLYPLTAGWAVPDSFYAGFLASGKFLRPF